MRRLTWLIAAVLSLSVATPAFGHDPGWTAGGGWDASAARGTDGATVALNGTLRMFHVDDFTTDEGRDAYAIETREGMIPLSVSGPPPEALNGARVRARGTWVGGLVRVDRAHDSSTLARVASAPRRRIAAAVDADGQGVHLTTGATAAKNVAVLLFNFSDDSSQPYTPASARMVAFTNGNAMAAYFQEESRGAITVSGQVYGWYSIAASKSSCDPFTWASQARNAASAAGVNLGSYTNVVFAFPKASSCGWSGLGEMPGQESWNNGAFSLRVVAHELGHNFGVHHASSLSCTSGGVRVSISTSCTSSEYGDPFTVMGSGTTRHDHATHLGQFGWLPQSEVLTVGPGGPYELGSLLDGPPGSPRLIRIDRHNGTWFYLDLRSVHGPYFDDFSPGDPAVKGITIRISPDAPNPSYGISQTQLVDATPNTATYADAPLAVGASLVDPVSGLRITTVSAGSGVASVSVSDAVAPGVPGGLTATATSATAVALSWSPATDNDGVDHYRVVRDGVQIGSPSGTGWTDAGRSPSTTYAYQVIAVDGSGNEGPAASASATTPPAGDDVTAPSAPRSLKAKLAARTTKLYWTSAWDDVGVAGYRVYRVGVSAPIKTVAGRSVIVKRRNGARYFVRAYDAAGNVGPRSPIRRT